MKTIINQLFNIVFVVIFIGVISSCSKDDPTPESPKPSTINVTGVSLNKSTLSLAAGTHETLTATIAPSNATNKSVSWSSDKSDVATVDANGSVSSLKVGEANITVTTVDGSKTASCKVTVTEVPVAVTGIALNKTEMKLGVGGVDTLKVTFTPANATNKKVTWQINDATIAKVEDGVITALKAGEATITATSDDGSKTATCKLTVNQPIKVTSVKLNKSVMAIRLEEQQALIATITPENASNKNVTWKSDDLSIATVGETGIVQGLKIGNTIITVTTADGNKTAQCTVYVTAKDVAVTSVSLNKTSTNINIGASETLIATVSPDDATNKTVTWTSSNPAVVQSVGGGAITAKSAGTADITVKTEDGDKTATCKVTVNAATVLVSDISLHQVWAEPYEGGFQEIQADIIPNNAANKGLKWSFVANSGESQYFTLEKTSAGATTIQTAKLTCSKPGGASCYVFADALDGSRISRKTEVHFSPVYFFNTATNPDTKVTSLSLSKGESMKLILATSATGAVVPQSKIVWSTSDASVATVSDGLVTITNGGTCTISAKINNLVTKTLPVTGIAIGATNMIISQNQAVTYSYADPEAYGGVVLGVTLYPANSTDVVSWASENINKASVVVKNGKCYVYPKNVTSDTYVNIVASDPGTSLKQKCEVRILPYSDVHLYYKYQTAWRLVTNNSFKIARGNVQTFCVGFETTQGLHIIGSNWNFLSTDLPFSYEKTSTTFTITATKSGMATVRAKVGISSANLVLPLEITVP